MSKTAVIYLVGPVGIFVNEEGIAEGFTIDSVIAQVQSYKDQEVEEYLFKMAGPGGYVDEGDAIFDYMRSLSKGGIKIATEQIGDIGSIMTKLFLAPLPKNGERRLVSKGKEFMIHNPWGEMVGNASDMKKAAEELEEVEKELRSFYTAETGITDEGLKPLMDKESRMSAEQAIQFGFATGYAEEEAEPVKALAMFKSKPNTMSKEDKSLLDRIKALVTKAEDDKKKDDEPKAIDLKTESGDTIRVDAENEEGAVGQTAMIVDADGNEEAAPAGDHMLDDGRILVIGEGGVVNEFKEAEEEPETELAKLQKKLDDANKALEGSISKEEFDKKVNEAVEAKMKEVGTLVEKLEEKDEEVDKQLKQFKAMKTIYKVKPDADFVKELEEQNEETNFAKAKRELKEKQEGKDGKKPLQRGKIVGKVQ